MEYTYTMIPQPLCALTPTLHPVLHPKGLREFSRSCAPENPCGLQPFFCVLAPELFFSCSSFEIDCWPDSPGAGGHLSFYYWWLETAADFLSYLFDNLWLTECASMLVTEHVLLESLLPLFSLFFSESRESKFSLFFPGSLISSVSKRKGDAKVLFPLHRHSMRYQIHNYLGRL